MDRSAAGVDVLSLFRSTRVSSGCFQVPVGSGLSLLKINLFLSSSGESSMGLCFRPVTISREPEGKLQRGGQRKDGKSHSFIIFTAYSVEGDGGWSTADTGQGPPWIGSQSDANHIYNIIQKPDSG